MESCELCWGSFETEDLLYEQTSVCPSCIYVLEHSRDEYLNNTFFKIRNIECTANSFFKKSKDIMTNYLYDIDEINTNELNELKQEYNELLDSFNTETPKIASKVLIYKVKDEIAKQKGVPQKALTERYKISMKIIKAYKLSPICQAKKENRKIIYTMKDVENMFELQSIYRRFRYDYYDLTNGIEHLKIICDKYRINYLDIA